MGINRQDWVSYHNPRLNQVQNNSPLSVGNGDFAYTCDITGFQSLYEDYLEGCPLTTMSQWGWHSQPPAEGQAGYTLADLDMTHYRCRGRDVVYPIEKKPGNQKVYDWLRENPHRFNLGRIGLMYGDRDLQVGDLSNIEQALDLYSGTIKSHYQIGGRSCQVTTVAHAKAHTVGFRIEGQALGLGQLKVAIDFPYGDSGIAGALWDRPDDHMTVCRYEEEETLMISRTMDGTHYQVLVWSNQPFRWDMTGHRVMMDLAGESLDMTFTFIEGQKDPEWLTYEAVLTSSRKSWQDYWETSAAVRLRDSDDPRACELERRIVLSQYVLRINSCGSMPPAETGLTCNSWYGKSHLEMYFWHLAWAPLWGQRKLMEKSLRWYEDHLQEARNNAAVNGYKGARWPKMIGYEGIDCPSPIAPLLIWQQPHVIMMLNLAYKAEETEIMNRFWPLIQESADFMADFAVYNPLIGLYDLPSPLIPVQECHPPQVTENPAFELAYWRYGLELAIRWAKILGKTVDNKWLEVSQHMADLSIMAGKYLAHSQCPDTFTAYKEDHPSMLMAYGVLPGQGIQTEVMEETLNQVINHWQDQSLWGWDFAVMAMTAIRLGKPDLALDLLLKDTEKNRYEINGHNRQETRKDLPLYLPGNGSLLLAVAMMVAGYEGCDQAHPGFLQASGWQVVHDGLLPYV